MRETNEKKKVCIYIDTEDMKHIKNIVAKRGGVSIAHVYNDFLLSVMSCENIIFLKKDKFDGSKKKQYAIVISSEMTNTIDARFNNCINYSKSFACYAKDFIQMNKNLTIWERLKYPTLRDIYVRPENNKQETI